MKDLADGIQTLAPGQRVAFQAYTDDSGIGAEAVYLSERPSEAECDKAFAVLRAKQARWQLGGEFVGCRWVQACFLCKIADFPPIEHFVQEREEHPTVVVEHGIKYTGNWRNGLAEGFGKFVHADGDVYEGQWKGDKANGEGVYHHADGSRYVGQWRDDQKEGQAIEEWADNSRFEGQYRAGKKHGHGTFTWAEGSSYEGEFENNEIHGQGTYFWNDGRVYRGQWANNRSGMLDDNFLCFPLLFFPG
eukprot:g16753.t1